MAVPKRVLINAVSTDSPAHRFETYLFGSTLGAVKKFDHVMTDGTQHFIALQAGLKFAVTGDFLTVRGNGAYVPPDSGDGFFLFTVNRVTKEFIWESPAHPNVSGTLAPGSVVEF